MYSLKWITFTHLLNLITLISTFFDFSSNWLPFSSGSKLRLMTYRYPNFVFLDFRSQLFFNFSSLGLHCYSRYKRAIFIHLLIMILATLKLIVSQSLHSEIAVMMLMTNGQIQFSILIESVTRSRTAFPLILFFLARQYLLPWISFLHFVLNGCRYSGLAIASKGFVANRLK